MAPRHQELLQLFHTVNRGIFDQVKDIFERHGLPSGTMAIIHQIRRAEGVSLSELARRTGMVKSYISRTLESLVEQGLVEKRSDPSDQRLIRLYSTESCRGHFGLEAEVHDRLGELFAAMPDEKLEALADGLRSLKAVLEQRGGSRTSPAGTKGDDQP